MLVFQIATFGPADRRPTDLVRRLETAHELAERSGHHAVAARVEVLQSLFAADEGVPFSRFRETLLHLEARIMATRDPEAMWLFHYFLSTPMLAVDPAGQRQHEDAAAAISATTLGPGHAYTQIIRQTRAPATIGSDVDALRSNLDELERMYGPESPRVAEATRGLALGLQRNGKLAEALVNHQETIRLWTAIRGSEALEVGEAWHELAQAQRQAGDLPAAEAALQRAVEVFRANPSVDAHGTNFPLSTTLESLANVLLALGRTDEAVAAGQRAYQACVAIQADSPWCDGYLRDQTGKQLHKRSRPR